jgi:hypothetical protein
MSISRKARGPAVKLELDPTDLEWDDWEAVSLPKLLRQLSNKGKEMIRELGIEKQTAVVETSVTGAKMERDHTDTKADTSEVHDCVPFSKARTARDVAVIGEQPKLKKVSTVGVTPPNIYFDGQHCVAI